MFITSIILLMMTTGQIIIFDFSKEAEISAWIVVDDVVMGGRSQGKFEIDSEGFGAFSGNVSLENNGGFSSLRYSMTSFDIEHFSKIRLRIKGDGKRYQFRIKANRYDRHSYIQYFETNGKWQNIDIALKDMYPTYRGRNLSIPNFQATTIEELGFLISNKKEENFKLLIEEILVL